MRHKSRIYALFLSIIALNCNLTPARSENPSFGVVKTSENSKQWLEISDRLKLAGVNYCILDWSQVKEAQNLAKLSILLLPNIETVNGEQAKALQTWSQQGGRFIVSGPVGNLSQPEIKNQLRLLFGGYWGFSLSEPATLDPLTSQALWSNAASGSATIMGGVMIPMGQNSQKVAVWLAEGKPPAVLVTDNAVLLGWRWGINRVTSPAWDASWLQQALKHYGKQGSQQLDSNFEPKSCLEEDIANNNQQIPLVPLEIPESATKPENNNPHRDLENSNISNNEAKTQNQANLTENTQPVWQQSNIAKVETTPWQLRDRTGQPLIIPQNTPESPVNPPIPNYTIRNMEQELEGLIARFESTLLTADAYHTSSDLSININTEQLVSSLAGDKSLNVVNNNPNQVNSHSHQALTQAKTGYQQFKTLIQEGKYQEAQAQWQATRDLLWQNYPSDRYLASPEIRAIWLDRGTIVKMKSEADMEKLFDQFANAGINIVFIETVNASYPIYKSKVAPEQNPMIRGWDPLAAAVKLAHERKMEIHAWVWIFAAANQRHNEILRYPLDYPGPVLSRHPDWAITDQKGNLFQPNTKKAFLDPSNPEVRQYLFDLLTEIATNYDVDGIQFDYIRYPFQDPRYNLVFGYSGAAREQFYKQTGADILQLQPSDPLWQEWQDFKVKQVDSFVAEASQLLRQKRPELMISAAVFPFPLGERLMIIQQNWEKWLSNGDVDLIFPMTYAPTTEELAQLTQGLFSQDKSDNSFIIPGIRLLDLPDVIAFDQLQYLRSLPTSGYALFAAENLSPNFKTFLNNTQNNNQTTENEPLPYRQPFQAALLRYQSLQKEWSFLVSNKQLTMSDLKLKDWAKQVDVLAERLDKLAKEPSERNFLFAQVALDDFEDNFPSWMREYQQQNPYQVEVWSNRLTTIQNLLNYGQRKENW